MICKIFSCQHVCSSLIFLHSDKPKDPKEDSFAEKLATNVIKNLQINIKDIHIRYEDRHSNPKKPFSVGVTLKELLFQVRLN